MTAARRTVEVEIAGLEALRRAMEGSLGAALDRAVELALAAPGVVHVTGMGKSGHIARKVAATLASTGTRAHFLHPTEASHGDLGAVRPGDLLVAFSWSGDTPELVPLVEYARREGIPVIAATAHVRSLLGASATVCLEMPIAGEACPGNLAPTTSTTMQLVLGDALALAILDARALSAGQYAAVFRDLHPGGKLGARLTPARAIMHTGERMPLVAPGTKLSAAIVEMTGKGFGVAGVVNEAGSLVGMVTDGDLRRAFGRAGAESGPPIDQWMHRPVEQIMTGNPWTVEPEALAPEMLAHMNATRVTSAFVVPGPGAAPVGIVHLHDLLRIGL